MPTVRGRAEVQRFLAQLPAEIEAKLLRGAAKAAAKVVADEARDTVTSDEVAEAIVTRSRKEEGRIVVKITVDGQWPRSVGTWLEYGTDPHFITVDDGQRQGKSIKRINKQQKEGSLVIGGQFVGSTVFHPGARAEPFLRTSLDRKESEAIAAAQGFINSRVRGGAIVGTPEREDEG